MPLLTNTAPAIRPDEQQNQALAQSTGQTRSLLQQPVLQAPKAAAVPSVATPMNPTAGMSPTAPKAPAATMKPTPQRASAITAAQSQLNAYKRAAVPKPPAAG